MLVVTSARINTKGLAVALQNSPESIGVVSRATDWIMAVLILAMLPLGLVLASIEPGPAKLWLYGLHGTLGFLVLALFVLGIFWHVLSPRPASGGLTGWKRLFLGVWRWILYTLMIATPIAGWAGSSASGIDVVIARVFTLPPLVAPNETAAFVWFILHEIFAKTLCGMIVVHGLMAFRQEMASDGTTERMLRGRA